MRLLDKSNKLHVDKSSQTQMVDVPIDSPCCVELTDSRIQNTGTASDKYKAKSDGRSQNFYERRKCVLLTGAITLLLFILFLIIANLTFSIISGHDTRNASVRIQPEARVERVIRPDSPVGRRSLLKSRATGVIDGDPFFNDQKKLTSQRMGVAEGDAFLTINERDAATRSKRDVSRRKRDCNLKEKQCEMLLQTVQNLVNLSNKHNSSATINGQPLPEDILKCFKCKELANVVDGHEDYPPQPKDLYFPYNDAAQNRSSNFGHVGIKLLNESISNRTEATRIQPVKPAMNNSSQDVANQSSKGTNILETTTVSADPRYPDGSQRVYTTVNNSGVVDKQPNSTPAANDSYVTQDHNEEGVTAVSKIDQQYRATTKGKDVTSAKPESSSMRTQYSAITRDDEQSRKTTIAVDSTGTTERTRTLIDLLMEITENVTSVSAGYDVMGIDGGTTVHPSTRPSLEGHPENRSLANEPGSMENLHDYKQFTSANSFKAENNGKPIPAIAENTKTFQQLQPNFTTWSVPQLVCFFNQYSGQFSNAPASSAPASSAPAFYPDFSPAQSHGSPFQNPFRPDFSSPNYMQVQANTVQLPPRFNYADGPAQPTGPGIGPAGSAMSNVPSFSLNQQPTAMLQQSVANAPYFCSYISLPIIRFPPIPGTSQSDRSADEAKNLPKESGISPQGASTRNSPEYHSCPENYHQCDTQHCVLKVQWCDGRVDCTDASDETRCSCRDRIPRNRLCDGYFDCPHGEDELGCNGCPMHSFSCDEWNGLRKCVPLSERCDGKSQCSSGKDELDCNMLLETHMGSNDIFTVGYSRGYLHKNIRGIWYPVCSKTITWAVDACASEIGHPLTTMPKIQTVRVPNAFQDLHVIETDTDEVKITPCPGTAVVVKCPPLPCGIKASPRQSTSFASNAKSNYMFRRHAEEQSAREFNKLYQETLGLLSAGPSILAEKTQDQNDTIVGVVGGRASHPTAWPFVVAIFRDGYFHCGGVILSEVHILTAGHCMLGYEQHYYEIEASVVRLFSFSPTTQSRQVKYVSIHPDYRKKVMQNDIAVIMLDRPLLFNRWVRPICLPELDTAGSNYKEDPSSQSVCIAIGWGAVKENGPDSDHLREVEVPILPSCKYLPDQNNATICAGYYEGGHDACQGDSGGPLMCRNPNLETQWYAAGLISHGDGCGRPNEPGVYAKVSYYADWIQQTFQTLDKQITSSYGGNKPLDSCPGFSCQSSLKKCLPIKKRCDGFVNCLDGDDEVDCGFLVASKKLRESNSDNTFVKSQTDEIFSDTTEQNKASTEAIPISTSSDFFDQTETQTYSSKNSTTEEIYATTPEIPMSSVKSTFTCKKLLQTITINKKCNSHLDCEDGTDEEDCTCRDYLSNFQPMAICDGHLDCDDETDEKDCGVCNDDEFHCSRSGKCVPMTKKCDENYDCPGREDEVDCFALTNGEYVNVDSDNRPVLNAEGLLSKYYNGTWYIPCPLPDRVMNITVASILGEDLCQYLGFTSLQSLDTIVVNKTVLETRWHNTSASYESSQPRHTAASERGERCTALRFHCRPVLGSSADSYLVVEPRTDSRTYLWPWLAAIFVDGSYRCSALLLESDWLLSSSSCTAAIRLSVNYTTALLGQSRSFLHVDGPHQQVSVINEIRNVATTDVSLLHLRTAVNFTRYVQPLFLEKKIYPPARDDICVAIGTDNEHLTQSIFLQPILENCDRCYRCYVETSGIKCPDNGTFSKWSGTVFCRSEKGWYPAAVFHENDGPCSFQSARNLTSIDYIHAYLTQALEKVPQPTAEPACDGVRCKIGQCIPRDRVCDGVADCRDGADENSEMCLQVQLARKQNGTNRICIKSELRCNNGECISKSAFCDGKVDCLDGTDEPLICSCAEYLRLTKPERLCDGVRHCLDKTDESPEACQCTETSFKCNTESKNVTCISQDFVCDGDNDCPNGEDETKCRQVLNAANNSSAQGEVMQRSYGVWHTLCYPSLTQKEAANVCRENGYTDGIIDYDHDYQFRKGSLVPSRDNFYMVRINVNTWITMCDDKPITFNQPEKPCYRLFVKCS
ncbi:PREDICTED: serine protease nudel [Vollenhovia emeryi]|uniref:serine protease nudel n=1 Tax=Vollenhovia emeryi TaxID=411798 RepID=UPI0005F52D75|nr:PREDICTED: serine protease nudel [Vollenhovia emeryi]